MQQAISPKILQRDATGEIIRDPASARPLMVANAERIGFAAYCQQIAKHAPVEEAEPEAKTGGALAVVETGERVSPDLLDAQESALAEQVL